MTFKPIQISLVSGIFGLLDEQAKEQGEPKLGLHPHQMNAVIEAANLIVRVFNQPIREAQPNMGLQNWLESHDTGASSLAIVYRLYGHGRGSQNSKAHPLDPSDFGRCHRLLEAVPQARTQFCEMRDVSEVWARLVEHWEELTALYLEELPSGKAPKLYARMKALGC